MGSAFPPDQLPPCQTDRSRLRLGFQIHIRALALHRGTPVRTKSKLKSAAIEHMTKLEQDPDRVMAYFQDPFVKYAAAS